jgi:hypothetical protein
MTLGQVAREIASRLSRIFVPGDLDGRRPCHGDDRRFAADPHWRDLVLFHEYFHGDNGRGVGASHQTGWTALVIRCIEGLADGRDHDRGVRLGSSSTAIVVPAAPPPAGAAKVPTG